MEKENEDKLIKALENIAKELKKIAENTEDACCTLDEIQEHLSDEEEEEEKEEDDDKEQE